MAKKQNKPKKSQPVRKPSQAMQAKFLAAYAKCGSLIQAERLSGILRRQHHRWMKYPDYAERFAEAHEEAIDSLETEARRRAVEGVEKPVFGSGGQGVGTIRVGTVREYSDTLLIFLLKGVRPEKYRENSKVQLEGNVNHTGSVQIFIPENGR